MKKHSILLLLILLSQYLFAVTPERVFTEKSSVQSALSINPDILKYSQDLECAEQRVKESSSLYFPNIDLNLNLSKFNNYQPMIILGESSQFLVYLPGAKKDLYYSTRLSIWQTIYAGGKIRTINKLADVNMNRVKSEGNVIKSKVINNVKIIFNDCLYHKALVGFYDSKIKEYELRKIHIVRSEIEALIRKRSIEQFHYKKEILNLLNAIGVDLNITAAISDTLNPKMKVFDLEKCLLLAYQFRSEIKTTQDEETLDGLMLNLLSMQKYPNVSVGAAKEWLGDRIIGDESSWYFSINANIPIFDGGGSFARIKQGKTKVRESTIRRAKLENEIRLKVRQSFLEYDFWRNQSMDAKILEKNGQYDETDISIIHDLNRSYYNLELAVGVELDSY
jgi:hypothetical protein